MEIFHEAVGGVDAEVVVECGHEIARAGAAFDAVFSLGIAGADDAAAAVETISRAAAEVANVAAAGEVARVERRDVETAAAAAAAVAAPRVDINLRIFVKGGLNPELHVFNGAQHGRHTCGNVRLR